ncbi:FAD:protein FMN transferase [Nocardioides sp.]|uniref:FAD:protein FMN transferase n=1 Tax=Nocardioides sp. TaxID=35761 RepID=UPI002727741D|nr:FAD:protein FMN transferase [Nocardioides sp.]MDO9454534.1 FAD:protein FMN transferase [Nocardioides sp.]
MSTRPWRAVEQVMGLPISVALRGRHAGDRRGHDAWSAVVAELREVDRVFSTYRADSVVSRLDRGEMTPAAAPPEVREVLAIAERARVESGGAFDVRRRGDDRVVRLDPSGVVKGWAVQRAAAHLAALRETDYCLGGGGDVVARVVDPQAPAWQIGVEDPREPRRLVARVPLRDGAVATSAETHRGPHVVDARTGRRPTGLASVTVVAPDLTWADIDATAAFAMGTDGLAWLESRPGRSGLVVLDDGTPRVLGQPARCLPSASSTPSAGMPFMSGPTIGS